MNEEFSDYEVLVATSTDGGEITQEISWEVKASTDIVVWCDIAGVMDEGTFNYDGKSITIHAYDRPFIAYIMRKECAEYVISQNSSSIFSVDAILEQLKKNVRVLEQLEETDTRTLQCVDEVNPITDKNNRIGKVLSFDDEGNPVCEVEVDDVEKIKAYKESASASATSASASATKASEYADNASASAINAKTSETNAETIKGEIDTLFDGFDTEVENKQTEVIDAIDSHFSEITIELDKYADGTISEIEGIKNQAQALVDNALEIVDPEGFRQDTSANITDLQLFKSNTGALHFNGGILSTTKGAIKSLPLEFSIAFRLNITKEGWESISADPYKNFIGFPLSGWSAGHFGFSIKRASLGMAIEWRSEPGISGSSTFFINNLADYFKGDWVNVILSVSKDLDSKYYAYLYFDGKQIGRVILIGWTGVSALSYPFKINDERENVVTTTVPFSIADVLIFNFDITSADAPYTIADYQQGKPIPPSVLENTILALENYTVTNGEKKFVLDYSGNNNDAEITSTTGDVKGDNDNRMQTLIDFIKTLS